MHLQPLDLVLEICFTNSYSNKMEGVVIFAKKNHQTSSFEIIINQILLKVPYIENHYKQHFKTLLTCSYLESLIIGY